MPVKTIGTNNLEEEMAAMKARLESLIKESEEKDVSIKLYEERLLGWPRSWTSDRPDAAQKNSESEEEERASAQSETSDNEVHLKKDDKLKNGESPNLMTIKQIQDLIATTVQAQLRGGAHKNSPLHQALHQESGCAQHAPWLPTSKI